MAVYGAPVRADRHGGKSKMTDVAFVGLGTMGLAMARNIIKCGFNVAGYDISATAVANLVADGGVGAASAAAAATDCDLVITMLPVGDDVRTALFGPGGVLEGARPNTLVIDMSTINPFDSDDIRRDLVARGHRMIDAPVGRTAVEAVNGTLLIMAGGTSHDIDQATPVFDSMADLVIDCGGPGMGARMKIINNLMTTVLNVLTAEVLTLAAAIGLDRDTAINVMAGTAAGRGHMATTYPMKVLKGDLSPTFMIDLAKKDLNIALDISRHLGIPQGLARAAETVYTTAQAEGRGRQDWTAIFAMLRDKYAT